MIDNYDSFTFNLVQYLGELGHELLVKRNDEITLSEIEVLNPDFLMISPGPCSPNEAGISLEAIEYFAGKIPIFGVCLGHQSIGQAFGGNVIRADKLMHGKTSEMHHDGRTIFKGLDNPFTATRYHSLIVEKVHCRIALRFQRGQQKMKLWRFAINHYLLKGYSSTLNLS